MASMTLRRTPRNKERGPGFYTNIGQKGRRTGIALYDTGVRDENGLEPLPAFSSPQRLATKTPTAPRTPVDSSIYVAEDVVDGDDTTLPAESFDNVTSARSTRRSIPRSKSPRKSLIGGSPRRSTGYLSPSKNLVNSTPPQPETSSVKKPNRQLDFSMGPPRTVVSVSPRKGMHDPVKASSAIKKGKNKRLFDESGLEDGEEMLRGDSRKRSSEMDQLLDDRTLSGQEVQNDGDESSAVLQDPTSTNASGLPAEESAIGRGASDVLAFDDTTVPFIDDEPFPTSLFDANAVDYSIEESIEHDETGADTTEQTFSNMQQTPSPTDRLPDIGADTTADVIEVSEDEQTSSRVSLLSEEEDGSVISRRKSKSTGNIHIDSDAESTPAAQKTRTKGSSNKAPRERDPNVRGVAPPRATSKPAAGAPRGQRATSKAPARAGSAGPTRFIQRSETPATDDGTYKTRSGRASYKPLATWRGEKAIFGQRTDRDTPAPVTDIIRTEEIPVTPKPGKRKAGKPTGRPRLREIVEEEDGAEEEDPEPLPEGTDNWEMEEGIKVGMVMTWDPETEQYDEEAQDETELAYAADAIELKDVAGADFKMAKTLTLDFFGCGLVRLPPRSVKRLKNSRKMQMVFFVHAGRVVVTVANEQFTIGKGGQWLVPRGNFYGIANESYDRDATIFFAQGWEWSSKSARLEAEAQAHEAGTEA